MTDWRINAEISRRPVTCYSRRVTGPASGTTRTDELLDIPPGARVIDIMLAISTAGTGASTTVRVEDNQGSPVVLLGNTAVTATGVTRATLGAVDYLATAKRLLRAVWAGGTFTGAAVGSITIWVYRDTAP